ncbi:N-acetylmuramoyl-L-alanine amidase [Streptomyces sp. CT34]|uniref:peptidoglycan recognition protein family protein n=1 Tax=Streptomyces sp. CT34 TaxID=1553907 RepID=UPI00068C81E1|nr:N-acetylmuramoyl-L-alanine amidase [Streptomyces sp. CT34]
MPNLTWLADVLRKDGLRVQEEDGWQGRGHGEMQDIRGVLLHHTAGPAQGNYPSLARVRDGDASLPGPLAQLGLARDGTWIVIAAGVAWHAGQGGPWLNVPKDNANPYLIGVEAESVGSRFDWTDAQLDAYPRGVAALLRYANLPAERAIGHKEWAPGRKVDPAFWPGDMDGFRDSVRKILGGRQPAPPPPPPGQGADFSTWGVGVRVRKEAKLSAEVVQTLNAPTPVHVDFQVRGDLVVAEGLSNPFWAHVPALNGFLSNIFINNREAFLPGVPLH